MADKGCVGVVLLRMQTGLYIPRQSHDSLLTVMLLHGVHVANSSSVHGQHF